MSTKSMVGVNLDGPSDSSSTFPMNNLMKQSRAAGPVSDPIKGGFGVYGIPQGDFGCLVFTEGAWPKGEYDLVVEAAVVNKIAVTLGGGLSLDSKKVNVTGTTLVMAFYGSGWRKIELRPAGTTGKWRPEFLKAIEPFGMLRFMDLLRTNNATSMKFDERTGPESLSYNQFGMSYEDIFELANLTGKDIWINVPVGWVHTDFAKLAQLALKLVTNPAVRIYTEYSNEVWNGIFGQDKANFAAALVDPLFADESNLFYRGFKRTAAQAADLGYAFRTEFADSPIEIRPILAGQIGNEAVARKGLEFLKAKNVLKWIWGLAGAPYFGNMKGFSDRNDLPVDAFFTPYDFTDDKGIHRAGTNYYLDRAGSTDGEKARILRSDAKEYGLVPCLYEFGKDNGDYRNADGTTKSQAAKNAAGLDGRMGSVIERNVDLWFDNGGGPACYFILAARYGRFCWGATDSLDHLDVPIYKALSSEALKRVEVTVEPVMTIDAFLLDLVDKTKKPLVGNLDLTKDSTIEFTTDVPVAKLRVSVYGNNGAILSSRWESSKPYHLMGDNVPVKLPNSKYNIEAVAYDASGVELGHQMFEIVVGADELTTLRQQVATLQLDLQTAQFQLRMQVGATNDLQLKINKALEDLK